MNETQEKVVIEGQEHTIPLRDITLICTAPDFHSRIRYPNRLEISHEESLYHMDRVQRFHPRTAGMVAKVFKVEDTGKVTPDWCRREGTGVRHCAGLIDLTIKMMQKGVPVVWIHPESFLHASAQAELADVLISLTKEPVKTLVQEEVEMADGIAKEIIGDEHDT